MIRLVVDASVAVKWLAIFDNEDHTSQAQTVIDRNRRGEIALLVPDLFWAEIGNVLCKAVRRQACDDDEAAIAFSTMEDQFITTVPIAGLVESALQIALRHNRSMYDSIYVSLAVVSNCELLTADEKLANALAGHLPVKWLGAI